MPIFKASFDFTHNANGWTETFYLDYTDIRAAMESAKEFAPLRRGMLGTRVPNTGPRMETIRLSDVDVQRDALQYKIPPANQFGANPEPADNANLAIAVRCEGGALYRRTWYISGQPDACCENGLYVGTAAFEGAFNNARAFLTARQWGLYAQDRTTTRRLIASFMPPVEGVTTVNTVDPHGFAAGNVVQIQTAPGLQNIRGKYFVREATTPTSFKIAASPTGLYGGGGYVRRVNMVLQRFTTVEIDGVTRKSRGRPIGGPVGRRKRRKVA